MKQSVGTVDLTSDITLTFQVSDPFTFVYYSLGYGIFNTNGAVLVQGDKFTNTVQTLSLTARGVAAGTGISIGFWSSTNVPGITSVSISDAATTYLWDGGVSGVWTNNGGGWIDKFDSAATNYSNSKPVVAQFTNASAGTNVTVASDGVTVGNVVVDGGSYDFSGGAITMTNTTWSVATNRNASVASTLAGTTGLTKTDTGTLSLGGSNSYGGATTVSNGTLLVANGQALGSTASGTTVADGAQLRLNATNSGFTVGAEALTISSLGVLNGGSLRNNAGSNTWQGKITLAADAGIGSASGSSLTLDVASGNAIEAANFNLDWIGAGAINVNDSISLGTGGMAKTGSGLLTLSASNSYSGGTGLGLGTLRLDQANAAGSGTITQSNASSTLQINTTGTVANAMSIYNLSATQDVTLTGNQTLNGTNGTNATYNIASGTRTIDSGVLSGSAGLTKTGTGTLTLGGVSSNSYTGTTIVSQGVLELNKAPTPLAVVNGNFSNLTGLTPTAGQTLWYDGVPTGWIGLTNTFAVYDSGSGNYVANLSSLSTTAGSFIPFSQGLGTTAADGDVTVTFDLPGTFGSTYSLGAVIWNGAISNDIRLSPVGNYTSTGPQTLTATNVAAGTPITFGIWWGSGSAATLDNVLVSQPAQSAIIGNLEVASGATLLVSQSHQVKDSASVTLSGGTIKRASGVTEVFGNLNVTEASFIDFSGGTGNSLTFTGLNYTPSALLSLQLFDFTQGNTLVFQNTTDMSSLIGSGFTFGGSGGFGSTSFSGGTFTITAIPEPSTYVAAAALLGLMIWPSRRRLLKDAKSVLGLRRPMRDRLGVS